MRDLVASLLQLLLQVPAVVAFDARFWVVVCLLWASGSLGLSSSTTRKWNNDPPPTTTAENTIVIAYHKPPNVLTSHSDAEALSIAKSGPRRTVYQDIQTLQGWVGTKTEHSNWESITGIHSKLHAIGRLDCDTTGLLLLTNDGGLVHHVTNPTNSSSGINKTYEALIMGYHPNDDPLLEILRCRGVDIGAKYGGMTRPAINLTVLEHPTAKSTLVSITIGEGKNRQVRRMFHGVGSGVMKLKRTQIGTHLNLDGLDMGQWRILSDKEVKDALDWEVREMQDKTRTPRPHRKPQNVRAQKPRSRRKQDAKELR